MNFESEIVVYLPFVLIRNSLTVYYFFFHLDQKCRIFVTAYNLVGRRYCVQCLGLIQSWFLVLTFSYEVPPFCRGQLSPTLA